MRQQSSPILKVLDLILSGILEKRYDIIRLGSNVGLSIKNANGMQRLILSCRNWPIIGCAECNFPTY